MPKKGTLIIGIGKPKDEEGEGEGDDLMASERESAAEALASAIKGGDPTEIADAFDAMLQASDGDEEEEEAEEEMPTEEEPPEDEWA